MLIICEETRVCIILNIISSLVIEIMYRHVFSFLIHHLTLIHTLFPSPPPLSINSSKEYDYVIPLPLFTWKYPSIQV